MTWTNLNNFLYVAEWGKQMHLSEKRITLLLNFPDPIGCTTDTSGYSSGLNQLILCLRKRLADRKITDLFKLCNSVPLKVNIRRIKIPLN
jgi:hypothetical protein